MVSTSILPISSWSSFYSSVIRCNRLTLNFRHKNTFFPTNRSLFNPSLRESSAIDAQAHLLLHFSRNIGPQSWLSFSTFPLPPENSLLHSNTLPQRMLFSGRIKLLLGNNLIMNHASVAQSKSQLILTSPKKVEVEFVYQLYNPFR